MDYSGNTLLSLSAQYKKATQLTGLLSIVLLIVFGDLPGNTLFWQEVQNSGHTILFAIIAALVFALLREATDLQQNAPLMLYMAACFLSLLIGVLTEVMQLIMHSDASQMDVIRDTAGIAVGLGLCAGTGFCSQSYGLKAINIKRASIIALSLCVLAASMTPLANLTASYILREKAFPVVMDLKAEWSRVFIQTKHAIVSADNEDKKLVRVDFGASTYPGVAMTEPYPDWTSYKLLEFVIESKQAQPFDLVLRIHDETHNNDYADRFNRKLQIKTGVNYIRIPLHDIKHAPVNRQMDMRRIRDLTMFAVKIDSPLRFYMGAVSLKQ